MKQIIVSIVLSCCCFGINAQKTIMYTYFNIGINATSGYKKITDSGTVTTHSKSILNRNDSNGITKTVKKTKAEIDTLFITINSIISLHKKVKSKPSICNTTYGTISVFYIKDEKQLLLFCTPSLQYQNKKNKAYYITLRLFNLYNKLIKEIQQTN